jgi:dsDNA-binding SOS-regulon protein
LQHTMWDKMMERKWTLMIVYGAAQEENRESFMAELASFLADNKEPLLSGGEGGFQYS